MQERLVHDGDDAHRSRYERTLHRALETDDYVFAQLIPYIGNKRKLLPLIERALSRTKIRRGQFVDLFTGSTVVGRFAKRRGWQVVANDWEPYSHEIARGTIALNTTPKFDHFGGVQRAFEWLNKLPPHEGYVTQYLCPNDDEKPNVETERMFFTHQNGSKIDAIRQAIADLNDAGTLSDEEQSYILAALLYSVSYVSNTSGVFKGFHRGWGGQTKTALYRIRSELTVRPPPLWNNGRENFATCGDATEIAPSLSELTGHTADVAYIDPPYNQHPYGSNYHVLNTVVLWDNPPMSRRISKGQKSAIRTDWRDKRRSLYNSRQTAVSALNALLGRLDCRWTMLSYSTDGNMPLRDVTALAVEHGTTSVFTEVYKRYRVSPTRPSAESHNVEYVLLIDKARQVGSGDSETIEKTVLSHDPLDSESRQQQLS